MVQKRSFYAQETALPGSSSVLYPGLRMVADCSDAVYPDRQRQVRAEHDSMLCHIFRWKPLINLRNMGMEQTLVLDPELGIMGIRSLFA